MSKVSSIVNKLKKSYEDAFSDVKETGTVKRIFLDSPRMNFIFGGGFALGRIYEFYGPESGGKSTLATYIGSQVQQKWERPITIFVDFEYSFDETYANKLGLKTNENNFIFLRPMAGEDAFELVRDLIVSLPVGLVIWDSISATASRSQVEDPNKATFGGTAKVFSEGLKFINPYLNRYGTSLILISQERASMSMWGSDTKTTGGYAPKYYSSWRGRITRIDDIKEKGIKVGIVSKVRTTKSKIGIPGREAEMHLNFDTGFDTFFEYISFLVDLGIVKKAGAWFSNEEWGFKGQGKTAVADFLKENPDVFEQAKNTVNALLLGTTIIDEENEDEFLEENEVSEID